MINEIEKIEGDRSIATFEHDGLLFFKREFVHGANIESVTEIVKESKDLKLKKIMSYLSEAFCGRDWALDTDRTCVVHFKNGRILTIRETFGEIKKTEKV